MTKKEMVDELLERPGFDLETDGDWLEKLTNAQLETIMGATTFEEGPGLAEALSAKDKEIETLREQLAQQIGAREEAPAPAERTEAPWHNKDLAYDFRQAELISFLFRQVALEVLGMGDARKQLHDWWKIQPVAKATRAKRDPFIERSHRYRQIGEALDQEFSAMAAQQG